MSESNIDREDLDLTERLPPSFERDELEGEAPARGDAPAPARAAAPTRTVPPPIPSAARRKASIPPPIPARALARATGAVPVEVNKADDDSVDVDMNADDGEQTPNAPVGDVDALSDWFAPVGTKLPPLPPTTLSPKPEDPTPTPPTLPPLPAATPAPFSLAASVAPLARASVPPPLPLARGSRRGTLPPPARTATAQPFVVSPAPAATAPARTAQVFPALPSFPAPALVIEPEIHEAKDDPTPLPGPVVDRDDEAWFDGEPVVEERRSSTWSVGRSSSFPFIKLAIAAVLVGGLSAMTVILVRGDQRTSARRSSASLRHAPVTPDQARLAATPDQTPAPAAQVTASPIAQPAVATTEPAPATATTEPAAPTAQPAVATTEPAPAAQPAIGQPAVAEPAHVEPTTPTTPATIGSDVAVSSEPAGAVVTLIDNGVASVVGKTPLAVTLDRAHTYDVVLALPGYRTQLSHVDPKARALSVSLTAEDAAPAADTRVAETPAADTRVAAETHTAASASESEITRPRRAAKRTSPEAPAPRPTRVAAASKGSEGTLMVSSKPPCEIAIDGVATVLTTPQRAIKLKPGKHKVTLFNLSRKIDATYEVVIESRRPTKLIRDFMSGN